MLDDEERRGQSWRQAPDDAGQRLDAPSDAAMTTMSRFSPALMLL